MQGARDSLLKKGNADIEGGIATVVFSIHPDAVEGTAGAVDQHGQFGKGIKEAGTRLSETGDQGVR